MLPRLGWPCSKQVKSSFGTKKKKTICQVTESSAQCFCLQEKE